MKEEPKELEAGDPCPVCGGEFALVPDAAVKDGDALYRCTRCGYYTRLPEEADEPATPEPSAPARGAQRPAAEAEDHRDAGAAGAARAGAARTGRTETSRATGA